MSAITAGWLYVGWGAPLFETNYGLMQHSPSEIKEKLLKALDKEYNVVDMAAVLEIVTILERTPITKEALETTRLGRDINELRRRTKNESLAKRAKDLVRRWRDFLNQNEATHHPSETYQNRAPPPPAPQAPALSIERGGVSPALQTRGVRGSPLVSPAVSLPNSDKGSISPSLPQKGVRLQQQPISPAVSLPNSDKGSVSPALIPRLSKTSHSPVSPAVSLANSDKNRLSPRRGDAVPRTHASNKRLRKEDSDVVVVESPAKKIHLEEPSSTHRLNGDHRDMDCEIISVTPPEPKRNKKKKDKRNSEDIVKEKIASIARTPKVKTTQELLADLRSRSNDAPTNCVIGIDHDVARNKTEHIARFLRCQTEEIDLVTEGEGDEDETQDTTITEGQDTLEGESEKPQSPLPICETAEQILARLPPLDLDSIDWDESPPPSPIPKPVTDDDVDRVLNEHIESVNGNNDESNKESSVFREWHQVVSRTSYQGDLLHILPYVIID